MKLPFISRKKHEKIVDELTYKLECLLCHATGGRYSKAGYSLPDMERMVDDHADVLIMEAAAETEAELEARQWIPVTPETMPTEDEATLVSTTLGTVYQAQYFRGRWVGSYGMTWDAKTATHWQPLPKPAKKR